MRSKIFNTHPAFTLAEVLITLGIIGIIAAMTLPSLMVQTRERECVTKLKTVYSTITQAVTRATVDYGTPDCWNLKEQNSSEGASNINKILSPYFKVTQNCDTKGGCWYDGKITDFNSQPTGINYSTDNTYATFSTVDGVQLAFNVEDADCKGVFGTSKPLQNVCATFTVDVNGKKFPNQYGFDVFKFYITKYGVQPYGLDVDTTNSFSNTCKKQGSGYGCAAWAIFQANLDYLHCDDLSWTGKNRCKMINKTKYDYDL